MKKLLSVFSLIIVFGCSTITTIEESTEVLDKTIRIEVLTKQPEDDAIYITYYDYLTDLDNWQQYFFTYDTQGNAEPIVITLTDYDFRYVRGEIYRNNTIPTELSLKIYVDDELVIDESKEEDGNTFVNIKFDYDIVTGINDI